MTPRLLLALVVTACSAMAVGCVSLLLPSEDSLDGHPADGGGAGDGAVGDDDDAGGSDGDAGDAEFCATRSGSALCDDFDEGGIDGTTWSQDADAGTVVTLAASTISPPYGVKLSAPGSATNIHAYLSHAFSGPAVEIRCTVAFQLLAGQAGEILGLGTTSGLVDVRAESGAVYLAQNVAPYTFAAGEGRLTLGKTTRITLALTSGAGCPKVKAEILLDDVSDTSNCVDAPTGLTDMTFYLGVPYLVNAPLAWSALYDDVVCTVK